MYYLLTVKGSNVEGIKIYNKVELKRTMDYLKGIMPDWELVVTEIFENVA